MNTTKKTAPVRSNAEKAASARKLDAEAALFEAQAIEASAMATVATILASKAEADDANRRSADKHNNIYRFDGEVSSASVGACMIALTQWSRRDPGCDIEIIFSSGGGSVVDGFILFDFIRDLSDLGHHITTGVSGMAASMAGILVQAGDTRWAGAESWTMIHRAAFGMQGKTYENEDRVEWIRRVEARIIDIFVARTSMTVEIIKESWDRRDWWLSSEEALEFGLVDEVRGRLPNGKSKSKSKKRRKA